MQSFLKASSLFCLLAANGVGQQRPPCEGFLLSGLRENVAFHGKLSSKSSLFTLFSEDIQKSFVRNRNGGFELELPFEGLPIGGSARGSKSDDSWSSEKRANILKSVLKQGQLVNLVKSVVNPQVADLYKQCLEQHKNGFHIDFERTQERDILFTVKFVGSNRNATVKSAEIKGGEPGEAIKRVQKGQEIEIGSGGKIFSWTQHDVEKGSHVVLRTDVKDLKLVVPPSSFRVVAAFVDYTSANKHSAPGPEGGDKGPSLKQYLSAGKLRYLNANAEYQEHYYKGAAGQCVFCCSWPVFAEFNERKPFYTAKLTVRYWDPQKQAQASIGPVVLYRNPDRIKGAEAWRKFYEKNTEWFSEDGRVRLVWNGHICMLERVARKAAAEASGSKR